MKSVVFSDYIRVDPSDIQAVEAKLNNLPRRQSGYQTPKELFSAAAG
ncbi:hypothetical protein [Lentilactobacillus hilgardii]